MFRKTDRRKTERSKSRAIAGFSVALALGITALGVGVASSASATELPWTPQSTATLFPTYDNEEQCYDGGQPVLVNSTLNQVEGESLGSFAVNGTPLPGDAEYRVGPGDYTYTYVVTNLNSTTDPKESVTLSGSFTVVECEDPEPPASPTVGVPTATGSLVDGKPIATVTVPVTVPEGASGELGVWFGEEQPLSPNVTITESGNIPFTGEVPCGTTDFTVVLDGFPVQSGSVTIECTTPNPDPDNGGEGPVPNPNPNPNPNPDNGGLPDSGPGTDNNGGTDNGGSDNNADNGSSDKTISDSGNRPGAGTGDVVAASASSIPSVNSGLLIGAGAVLLLLAAWLISPVVRVRANR